MRNAHAMSINYLSMCVYDYKIALYANFIYYIHISIAYQNIQTSQVNTLNLIINVNVRH